MARQVAGREQSHFDRLKGKRLALCTGYHYAFANINADQGFPVRQFGASLYCCALIVCYVLGSLSFSCKCGAIAVVC